MIEPHRVADDFRGKPVSAVAGHAVTLPAGDQVDNAAQAAYLSGPALPGVSSGLILVADEGYLRRLRLRSSLTQSVESTGKIVLHEAAIAGRPFASEHLKSSTVGVHCLFQMHRVGFPLTQGPKGVAEVVLCRSPIDRYPLTGVFLQGRTIGAHGLFQTLSASLPLSPES